MNENECDGKREPRGASIENFAWFSRGVRLPVASARAGSVTDAPGRFRHIGQGPSGRDGGAVFVLRAGVGAGPHAGSTMTAVP